MSVAASASAVPSRAVPTRADYDVVVIGGGINGTGVARDCALRGLRVALFEKNDLAFGASGNNSGMIHGGVRYLTDHPEVTEKSCRDSGFIQQIAPHLLFRIPFLFPIPKDRRAAGLVLAAVDAYFDYYDVYQPLKRGKPHTRLTADEVRRLEPGLRGDFAGAITFDEWGTDGNRLCVLAAVDAREHGAKIFVHTEVTAILRERDDRGRPGRVSGVVARDLLTGERHRVSARVVVNATGAWAPLTAALAARANAPDADGPMPSAEGAPPGVEGGAIDLETPGPARSARVRPGKGIHVCYDRRLSNFAVVSTAIDGRQIFVMPWGNLSWIGTTDDDYFGDLDILHATTDEVRYLVNGVERVLPAVRNARVIGTTVGVRPTLYAYGPLEDELSREHEIVDHGARDGIPGFYSMIGGKLASFRIFAEEMTDVVARELGVDAPCVTHLTPLPGGELMVPPAPVAQRFGVPEPAVRRLLYRHGTRVDEVLSRTQRAPEERAVVCPCEPVLEAEVRHVCRHEHARTLEDVARRTRLGLGACGGMRCAHRGAQIVGQEHGYAPRDVHRMAARFLVERYRSRAVALDGAQVPQEEMLAARVALSGGLAPHAWHASEGGRAR
jgi:glycerol-3-phosphate dehydrogenase